MKLYHCWRKVGSDLVQGFITLRLLLVVTIIMIISAGIIFGCLPDRDPAPAIFTDDESTPEQAEDLPVFEDSEGSIDDETADDLEDQQDEEADEEDRGQLSESGEETMGGSSSAGNGESGFDRDSLDVIADGDYLLALVSKETTLKSDYKPSDLQRIPSYMNSSHTTIYLRAEALTKLEQLWEAAEADGVNLLRIRSAYRSYSTQDRLFSDYASRHGEAQANRFSARPGQSEHQLGTTVDFGGTSVDFQAAYADTEQGRWLADNAHLYGFVMSYPAGKEHITGYIFEPWHYRYIGVNAAMEWKQSGKTLIEFLETKPQTFQ